MNEDHFLEQEDWIEKVGDIAVEYTSLFIVPCDHSVSPYESFYRDTLTVDASAADSPYFQPAPMPCGMKGFICGTSTVAVLKYYRENGFEMESAFHDLPDHVACELEFLGRLYQAQDVEVAQKFFEEHFGRWIFTFLNGLEKQNHSIFYQRSAMSLKKFLMFECSTVSSL